MEIINTDALRAINKYHWFCVAYPSNFIEKCWADDPSLAEHFKGKFNAYYDSFGPRGVMQAFVGDLSSHNWMKLMQWIMVNFNDEQKL